jgi:hypothetical protein
MWKWLETTKDRWVKKSDDCDCDCGTCKLDEPTKDPKPVQLYELVIHYPNPSESLVFKDLLHYEYDTLGKDNRVVRLTLSFLDKSFAQLVVAPGWKYIKSYNQPAITDLEQVKTAWSDPNVEKLPEFPITLGDPKL